MSPSCRPARLSFLIGGIARSGTTLIQRLCCEMPDVWVPQETHFWSRAIGLAEDFGFPLQGEAREAAAEAVLEIPARDRLPVTLAEVAEEIAARRRRVGLWTLFESLVAAMSPSGRSRLGEKTPNHLLWWEHLTGGVEDLQIVIVTRDPRAVLQSHRSVEWGETDAYALAERWVAHHRAARDALRILGPDRILVLRYEDVVVEPEAAREALAGFLEVRPGPVALDERLLEAHPLFPARESWKARALEPVASDRIDAGKGLDPADASIVSSVCGALLEEFGYEGPSVAVPPPRGESRERIDAFRRWHASVIAANDLPIY